MVLVYAGYQRADAYVALFISLLIFTAAGRLVFENARSLMDMAPAGAYDAAEAAIADVRPPVELRRLRIRDVAGTPFVDAVIGVPATAALAESHAIADDVEVAVEKALPRSDIVVHVEPNDRGQTLSDRVLAAALSVPGVREAHNVTVFQRNDESDVSLHLKLPPDMTLPEGHAVAEQVERAISATDPRVTTVQSHLEPIEAEVDAQPLDAEAESRLRESVRDLVSQVAGAPPRELRFLDTDRGRVGFVTLALPPATTVAEAHRRASAVEQAVHQRLPEIRELVVHTEP
jgi:divalent metal cation (Fe/Co/Zn/Cd) transporter